MQPSAVLIRLRDIFPETDIGCQAAWLCSVIATI
jgi:hypothetical protein